MPRLVRILPRLVTALSVVAAIALAGALTGGRLRAGAAADKDATAADGGPAPLHVMTFNIRYDNPGDGPNAWPERRDAVAAFIRDAKPDIVGMQEVLHRQLEFLEQSLPEYEAIGVGREDGKTKGEYSPIVFLRARFEATASGTFWLSDTPDEVGSKSWGNNITRICTWATLTDKQSGRAFHVFNTHFDHESQPSREKSAELLARRVADRAADGHPAVVTGDFNAGETNPAIEALRRSLTETYRAVHPEGAEMGTFHGFTGTPGTAKIDHVFVTAGVEVESASVHGEPFRGRQVSDHFPVSAVIVLPD